jgi:hypothetical protein
VTHHGWGGCAEVFGENLVHQTSQPAKVLWEIKQHPHSTAIGYAVVGMLWSLLPGKVTLDWRVTHWIRAV